MGYKIKAAPKAIVYHYGGGTLSEATFRKKYLNHRNSLMMLGKNYELKTLIWVIPVRFCLEAASMILAVKQGDFKRIAAVIGSAFWNFFHLPVIRWERKRMKTLRKVPDSEIIKRMFAGTVALQYYLFGKKTYTQLVNDINKNK